MWDLSGARLDLWVAISLHRPSARAEPACCFGCAHVKKKKKKGENTVTRNDAAELRVVPQNVRGLI